MVRRAGSIGRWLIAGLAFAIVITAGYAWAEYQNFTTSVPHGAEVPALTGKDLDGPGQNILLIGSDSRAGATVAEQNALHTGHDNTTVNTDTMMILHIPADGSRPAVISFPRDSWVDIPGYGKGKLNSAYSDAFNAARDHGAGLVAAESDGIISTARTLSALTGLHIDHYVQIDLLGFYRISEAIGGVEVCLNHAQNPSTETDGTRHGFSGINLPAGVSVIKGAMALAFVRQRHGIPGGDLGRIRRQQYFLAAALRKVESAGVLLNPFKLHNLLTAVSSSLLTDPSLDLLKLARSFELLSSGKISFQTLPNNGPQVIYPDGVETAIVQVDYTAIPSFINAIIGKSPNLAKVKPAAPSTVTVDVLNGAEVYLLATRNAVQLRRLHFKTNIVDSTDSPVTQTVVQYPPGKAAAAKAVAAVVPGAQLIQTSSVHDVTLTLGTDGRQVRGLVPATSTTSTTSKPGATSAKHPSAGAPANGLGCID